MDGRVRIAGLQMLVTQDVSQNEGRIAEGLQQAAADGSRHTSAPTDVRPIK